MKISRKTEYALRTVLDLALREDLPSVSVAGIAVRQHIPVKFLHQILQSLKGAGLVVSRRGQKGGYHLARSPRDITVAQIVELTEGSLGISPCRAEAGSVECSLTSACPLREMWHGVQQDFSARLQATTLEGLCLRAHQLGLNTRNDYTI